MRSLTRLLVLLASTATVSCISIPPGDPWQPAPWMPEQGISAHRGARETHPENTLVAFEEAIRLGVAQIEFDVRATADGQLILMHDATVDRTTDGSGFVHELTLAQIKALDAGSWKDEQFAGERVPTLVEALDMMPSDIWLNVHLKGDPELAASVASTVVAEHLLEQAMLAVDGPSAEAARAVHPDILICDMDRKLTRWSYLRHAIRTDANFLQYHWSRGRPSTRYVSKAHEAGLRVNYCCADANDLDDLFDRGVNFPLADEIPEPSP